MSFAVLCRWSIQLDDGLAAYWHLCPHCTAVWLCVRSSGAGAGQHCKQVTCCISQPCLGQNTPSSSIAHYRVLGDSIITSSAQTLLLIAGSVVLTDMKMHQLMRNVQPVLAHSEVQLERQTWAVMPIEQGFRQDSQEGLTFLTTCCFLVVPI